MKKTIQVMTVLILMALMVNLQQPIKPFRGYYYLTTIYAKESQNANNNYCLLQKQLTKTFEDLATSQRALIYTYKDRSNLVESDLTLYTTELTDEDISEEIKYGEMELVAQLVQAEAGNQDLYGKQLVADVVYNRVDSSKFPDDVWEVVFQESPVQFSVIKNGAFDKAGWNIDQDSFKAAETEYYKKNRKDSNVLYFNIVHQNGKRPFKYGNHWFSY